MTDVFAFDTAGQAAIDEDARLHPYVPEQAGPDFWQGSGLAVDKGLMRGGAKVGQFIGMGLLAAPVALRERLTGNQGEYIDPLFRALDNTVNDAVDYWTPDAGTTGTAGRVLGGLSEIALPLMAGGGNPTLLLGSQEMGGATELAREGVAPGPAVAGGVIEGAASAAGFRIPFLGQSLATKMTSGAVGNLLVNRGSSLAVEKTLQGTGFPEQAKAYDPANLEASVVDVLSGLVFGGIAHAGRPVLPSERDALLTAQNAKHFQHDTAPGIPADVAASVAHQNAMEAAVESVLAGEPMDLSKTGVMDATFLRNKAPAQADEPGFASLDPQLRAKYREAAQAKPAFDQALADIAETSGGKAVLVPLKNADRAAEKVAADYGGDATKLKDILRGTIEVKDATHAQAALDALVGKLGPPERLRNLLDPFVPQTADGYRDIKANVRINGHVAEIQINTERMLAAKKQGHALYKKARSIAAEATREGRDSTPEEYAERDALLEQQRKIYAAAWESELTKLRKTSSGMSVPLWPKDSSGNGLPEGVSQAVQDLPGTRVTGTPSTSANSVPAGKEAGSIESPPATIIPAGKGAAEGQANQGAMEPLAVRAARDLLKQADMTIPTGEIDANGNPVLMSARERMTQLDAEIAQAQNDAKAFDALAGCILSTGP